MRGIITNPNISMLGRMRMRLSAVTQRIGDGFNFLSPLNIIRSALSVRFLPAAVLTLGILILSGGLASCKKGDIYSCPSDVNNWDTVAAAHLERCGQKKPFKKDMLKAHAEEFRSLNDVSHPWDACYAWRGGAVLKSPTCPEVEKEVPVIVKEPCKEQPTVSKPSGPIKSRTLKAIVKATKERGPAKRLIRKLEKIKRKAKRRGVVRSFEEMIKTLRAKLSAVQEAKTEGEAKRLLKELKNAIEAIKRSMKLYNEATRRIWRSPKNPGMNTGMDHDWTKRGRKR